MIGKRRRHRREQARAAIERYEYQHANDQRRVESAELRADRAEAAERSAASNVRGMAVRLEDANAELARWGLEPVTRDGAESAEHPQRYRRASDWRTYRSGTELVELLERSGIDPDGPVQEAAIPRAAPPGVDVTIEYADRVAVERGGPLMVDLTAFKPTPEAPEQLRRQRDEALAGVGELSASLREAEEDRLRVMRELGDALTAASAAEGTLVATRAELAEQSGELLELRSEVDRLREMRASEGDWVERETFEVQRTEAERLQRQNDVLTGEVTRLKLLQENLTPLPPVQGDVITVRLHDGRTQRCTVRSVMPVGDLGFSLSLEPESPPL